MGIDVTGIGSVADLARELVSRFLPEKMGDADKAKAQMDMQQILLQHENAVIEAQRSVIVAEMNQADVYTKRARPSIVYMGLAFIGLVHVALPVIAWISLTAYGRPLADMPAINLPTEFWWAWSGVCGVWVIGRTMEKNGAAGTAGKIAGMIGSGK